jgi:hypothetical protein
MKTQIFKRAWELFKKYNITFNQALTKSWNEFKRSLLVLVYNKIPSKAQYAKKKLEAKKAFQSFVEVDFLCVPRNIANNEGACNWYGIGAYNAD